MDGAPLPALDTLINDMVDFVWDLAWDEDQGEMLPSRSHLPDLLRFHLRRSVGEAYTQALERRGYVLRPPDE